MQMKSSDTSVQHHEDSTVADHSAHVEARNPTNGSPPVSRRRRSSQSPSGDGQQRRFANRPAPWATGDGLWGLVGTKPLSMTSHSPGMVRLTTIASLLALATPLATGFGDGSSRASAGEQGRQVEHQRDPYVSSIPFGTQETLEQSARTTNDLDSKLQELNKEKDMVMPRGFSARDFERDQLAGNDGRA